MLCYACTRLFAGRAENASTEEQRPLYKMHHEDSASFRRAKDLGCGICSKAWRKFMTDNQGREDIAGGVLITASAVPIPLSETRTMNVLQLDRWTRRDPDGSSHMVLTTDGVLEGQWMRVRGASYLHGDVLGFEMIPTGIVHFPPSHTTKTKFSQIESTVDRFMILESYSIVREWLRSCLHDHLPRITDQTDFFPDRVVDIGLKGDRIIKLQSRPSGDGQNANYATLSYCWGGSNHIRLEIATLKRFQEGINVMELPRTMRHAVALVRELGLRFLWIDSLCIIQDSVEDWRTQSALMGSIYQHSHINLAASSSTNSEGGLVFDRDPQPVQPVQVTCRFPFDHATNPSRLYNILLQKPYFESIEKEPLNSRGWVMQERLLAPRTLHCAKDQLFWECEHMFANESHPNGTDTLLNRQPNEFRRMVSRFSQGSTTATAVINSIHREPDVAWLSLVREYTKCKLTRDEDILIAFSGLARRWSEMLPDQYLAGLWKQSLEEGLLWHREAMILKYLSGETSLRWRAPSWSWASFKGAVSWSPNVVPYEYSSSSVVAKVRLIRLVSTDLVSASADRFGQLLFGSITVRAALLVGLAGSESRARSNFQDGTVKNESTCNIWPMVIVHGVVAREIVITTKDHEYTGFCYLDTADMRKRLDREGFLAMACLPILLHFLRSKGTGNDAEVSIELQGIFVEMVGKGRTSGRSYKRVGYFSATSKLGTVRAGWNFHQSLMNLRTCEILSRLGFGESEDIVLV
ncbi:hypothetical protein FGG08_006698 [Glutinoglossum americanum]|uniref:Heterokaryon incompatibility domain-containing protein n=1 Tax=Glutinoglossum americanum TaxID=1670608 RepID=A0A9P8HS54_9PEZI|nr:hypothetical protein FGG08_006698 [Glutinoglossum americanum]